MQPTTDVFKLQEIPTAKILKTWKAELEECTKSIPEEWHCYVETGEGERYNREAINAMMLFNKAASIREKIKNELVWSGGHDPMPVQMKKEINSENVKAIQDLIWKHRWDQILDDYSMDSEEISRIGCENQLPGDHIKWFFQQFNRMQSDVFCVYPSEETETTTTINEDLHRGNAKSTPEGLVFVFNVGHSEEGVFIGTDGRPGWHFSFCYVDVFSRTITYGDSLGWPLPDGLLGVISKYYQDIIGSAIGEVSIKMCHDPAACKPNGTHACSSQCVVHFPLQTDRHICGVVALLISALACLKPDLFQVYAGIYEDTSYRGTVLLQHSSVHTEYLRKILAAWLAKKTIDVDYLTPVNFELYRSIAQDWERIGYGPKIEDLEVVDLDTGLSLLDQLFSKKASSFLVNTLQLPKNQDKDNSSMEKLETAEVKQESEMPLQVLEIQRIVSELAVKHLISDNHPDTTSMDSTNRKSTMKQNVAELFNLATAPICNETGNTAQDNAGNDGSDKITNEEDSVSDESQGPCPVITYWQSFDMRLMETFLEDLFCSDMAPLKLGATVPTDVAHSDVLKEESQK